MERVLKNLRQKGNTIEKCIRLLSSGSPFPPVRGFGREFLAGMEACLSTVLTNGSRGVGCVGDQHEA